MSGDQYTTWYILYSLPASSPPPASVCNACGLAFPTTQRTYSMIMHRKARPNDLLEVETSTPTHTPHRSTHTQNDAGVVVCVRVPQVGCWGAAVLPLSSLRKQGKGRNDASMLRMTLLTNLCLPASANHRQTNPTHTTSQPAGILLPWPTGPRRPLRGPMGVGQ